MLTILQEKHTCSIRWKYTLMFWPAAKHAILSVFVLMQRHYEKSDDGLAWQENAKPTTNGKVLR
jgi:hypothetical protein